MGRKSVGIGSMDQSAPAPADPHGDYGRLEGYPDDDSIRALPENPPGFKCTACGDCCRTSGPDMGVTLNYPDVLRLSAHLNQTPEDFIKNYTEQVIFAVGEKKYDVFYLNFEDDACRFLGPDNLCTIHSVKPWQCRFTLYRFFHSDDPFYWCQKHVEVPADWTSREHDAIFIKGLREVPAQTQEAKP
jgi:Fe-S-cluster containining protein